MSVPEAARDAAARAAVHATVRLPESWQELRLPEVVDTVLDAAAPHIVAAAVLAVQADNNRRIEALAADYYEAAEAITYRDTGSLARRDVYRQAATNIRALRAALASPAEPGGER